MAVARKSRSRLGGFLSGLLRRGTAAPPEDVAHWHTTLPPRSVPKTWAEGVADVDPTLRVFVAAASEVDGVVRIVARTAGPRVSFILSVEGRDWSSVVDDLEPRLRPLYLSGLSSFDYDVIESERKAATGSGFTEVFSRPAERQAVTAR